MTGPRLLPTALLALCVGLVAACGDPTPESGGEGEQHATVSEGSSVITDLDTLEQAPAKGLDTDASTEDDWALLRTTVSEDKVELLGDLALSSVGLDDVGLEGAAAEVPDPDTNFPIEGPRKGALFSLGTGRGFYEFSHNEHWGISALYLYDAQMRPRQFDAAPALNVHCDEESFTLEPSRKSFDEVEDGGWHFEDDALLGYPDSGRFRFTVDGRTYTPIFAHIHVGHGHTHPSEHATGPHIHGLGPHKGYVLTLGAHLAHVEVVHKPHWGILAIYVYDAAMEPRALDEAPILNIVADGESHQLTAGLANWDGEEDGGWHFEDDVLLGETGPARFRLVVDEKTWTPRFTYYTHGEEPGHAHAADGEARGAVADTAGGAADAAH